MATLKPKRHVWFATQLMDFLIKPKTKLAFGHTLSEEEISDTCDLLKQKILNHYRHRND